MKKSQVLTGVLSAVAIASGVLFSTSSAQACLSKKHHNSHTSSYTDSSPPSGGSSGNSGGGSGGSLSSFFSKTLPLKSDNASMWMAAGAAGLFGLGALYLTMNSSPETAAVAGDIESNNPEAPVEALEGVVEPVISEQPEGAV